MVQRDFTTSKSDTFIFIKHVVANILVILIYVDDIFITGSNSNLIKYIISKLDHTYALKDFG